MARSIITVYDLISRQPAVTVPGTDPVESALRAMERRGRHAAGIMNGPVFTGLFTYEDFIRRVIVRGLNPRTTRLSDVMTLNPLTIRHDCALQTAFEILCREKISHLPVISDGKFYGILSEDDVRPQIVNDLQKLTKDHNLLLSYIYGEPYAMGAVY